MKIKYENTCKVYTHACLTLYFPNMPVHSFFFFFLKLLHASFILALTKSDFTLQMKVQNFLSH